MHNNPVLLVISGASGSVLLRQRLPSKLPLGPNPLVHCFHIEKNKLNFPLYWRKKPKITEKSCGPKKCAAVLEAGPGRAGPLSPRTWAPWAMASAVHPWAGTNSRAAVRMRCCSCSSLSWSSSSSPLWSVYLRQGTEASLLNHCLMPVTQDGPEQAQEAWRLPEVHAVRSHALATWRL